MRGRAFKQAERQTAETPRAGAKEADAGGQRFRAYAHDGTHHEETRGEINLSCDGNLPKNNEKEKRDGRAPEESLQGS